MIGESANGGAFPGSFAPTVMRRRAGICGIGLAVGLAIAWIDAAAAEDWPAELALSSLNGKNGFRIEGDYGDAMGASVSGAGDVNGDGFGDVIVAAPGYYDNKRETRGSAFVVLGRARNFDPVLKTREIGGRTGFAIASSAKQNVILANAVAGAGDINRDGLNDVMVSAFNPSFVLGVPYYAGITYVVFGMADVPRTVIADQLDGKNGFRIVGAAAQDASGSSLAAAGDVNGDGFDDILVGAPKALAKQSGRPGAAYVIFGKHRGFLASYDLANLKPADGFQIVGSTNGGRFGESVAGAGDIDGDGYADFVVGAPEEKAADKPHAGTAYVIFGRSKFSRSLSVADLDGRRGFRIEGASANDKAGTSVGLGDVNCDGYSDVIVGAPFADTVGGYKESGAAFVVFGRKRFEARVVLTQIGGDRGFQIDGQGFEDRTGAAVAAGDINADGCDDMLIGAPAEHAFTGVAGSAYLVFGHKKAFANPLKLSSLKGKSGFQLKGSGDFNDASQSVAVVPDVNRDGFADMLVGAPSSDVGGDPSAGLAYTVFGH